MQDNSILSELDYLPDEGSLRFKDVRYLLVRPETLASLQAAFEQEIGPNRAGDVLYSGGFAGGRLSGRRYKETFGYSDQQAVEFMCRMGGEIGWGRFKLIGLDTEDKALTVEVEGSPFAAAYIGRTEVGVCHLIRGVLGGLVSGLFQEEVRAVELLCLARGDPYCRFEVRGLG